jgi:serine/threonine protein kinase
MNSRYEPGQYPLDTSTHLEAALQELGLTPEEANELVPTLMSLKAWSVPPPTQAEKQRLLAALQQQYSFYYGREKTMPDRIGQQFGQYKLVSLLGLGGFAEVYLGEHIELNAHQAAVKILKHAHLTVNDREQFRQEARIIADLRHKHIVRIFDFGVEGKENVPFLVMEYAPNGSLRQRYPRGTRLALSQVVDYVHQIAEALQHAHDHKVIHCDIKPENMLLGSQDEILLSDFGIAVITHTTTPVGQRITEKRGILGTLEYMAPERFDGKPCEASDQYSLGIVVYEWLCGTPPFQGDDLRILAQHMRDLPPSLHQQNPDISPSVEKVVLRALEKRPEARYPSIAAFDQAFQEASRGNSQGSATSDKQKSSLASANSSRKNFIPVMMAIILTIVLTFATTWIGRGIIQPPTKVALSTCLHTLTVTTPEDNASASFREMIDKAQNGDCITFDTSLKGSIVLTSGLEIKHSITIQGNGPLPQEIESSNTIQGDEKKATPTITNDTYSGTNISIFPNTYVTFINLSFQGSDTFLENSLISNQSRNLNIISCNFRSFHSHYTGGVISNLQGNVTLKDSYLRDNQSLSDGGGAIYNQGGTVTLDHSTVTSNYADYSGGGIYNVGGNVYIQNNSSLNQNKLGQEASQGGGGGGIISRGGSIVISDSEIRNNEAASGDGGGVFLVNASAQIIASTVMFNEATSQKGRDIAVEADFANEQNNYLFIDPRSSYDNIWGETDQKYPGMISSKPLSTPSSYDPTKNNPHFVGSLTTEQFRTYCNQLKGKSFTNVIMGTDEEKLQCTSNDNNTSVSFSALHISVIDVCAHIFSDKLNIGNKEHILARLASYWDPSSWQCFGNMKQKEKTITRDLVPEPRFAGETWLDRYCYEKHGKRASLLPLPRDKQTGYQWKCTNADGSSPQRIIMSEACKQAYDELAVDFLVEFTDPYSWYCWVPTSPTPTATTTTTPMGYNFSLDHAKSLRHMAITPSPDS